MRTPPWNPLKIVLQIALLAAGCAWAAPDRLLAQTSMQLSMPIISGGQARLEWNSGGELQAAPSAAGPWVPVDAPTLRQSVVSVPIVPEHRFFRVVENGIASAPMPLLQGDPSRPFRIERAFLRRAATPGGNALLEAELMPGQNPPQIFPLLQDDRALVFSDNGQGGDAKAGDGIFTAPLVVNEDEFKAANEFVKSFPPGFRVSGNFDGRNVVSGILPTTIDLEGFLRGERIQVHPSPFDGRGLIPDGFSVPGGGVGKAAVGKPPVRVVEVCSTNVVAEPRIIMTNLLITLRDRFLTNIDCKPLTGILPGGFRTNILCEERVVGFHEPRKITNIVCEPVIVPPNPVDVTQICVTNVVPNPLRLMTNIICADIAVTKVGLAAIAAECKTNIVLIADAPEFLTNVTCVPIAIARASLEPVTRTVCLTNVFTDLQPLPITQMVCATNLVPVLDPVKIEDCVTNIIIVAGGQVMTNVAVPSLVLVTNVVCTNVIVGVGATNVIELPIDDFINRPTFWQKSLLITDLSVVEDPLRTWDPCVPERGTKMGAWTFGRLMTDVCNPPASGIDASEFARRWLRSWQHDLSVNFDTITNRNAEILSQVIRDWEIASGGPGAPLDLSIAPFRLLAIVNRVDLRGNPGYGGVDNQDPCNPVCIGGEGRFVFGLVPGLRRSGGGGGGYGGGGGDIIQSSCDSFPFTVIFEYCVPKNTCAEIKDYAQQWYQLSQIQFGPEFNTALQNITDQFARPGADPARKPNMSALNQLRANELLRDPWVMREWRLFNNDSDAGWLREVTVKQTPDFDLNFSKKITEYCLANASQILAQQHVVPLQFLREPFLGGDSPMPTKNFFWDGPQPTGTIPGEIRHKFSLNTCSGCHAGETSTPFTHVFPRAFGQPAALSDFLTGLNMPKLDPADHVTLRFFADLKRREDDLLRLIKEPCFFQIFHAPAKFEH